MTFSRVFSLFFIYLLLSACSTPYAPVSERRVTTTPGYHLVNKGETLYSIAWLYGLDYKSLARANNIDKPYSIWPGQRLALKRGLTPAQQARRKAVQRPSRQTKWTPSKKPASKKPPVRKQAKKPHYRGQRVGRWLWPTKGRVIRYFSSRSSGKKGIAIAGRSGQPVIAAAGGKVVYSGHGLVRYGKLIIIKHNNTFLSAYAHNRRLLVKEGSVVKQGQKIAEMGRTGEDRTLLHFEIRKNGKPVNPLSFLPKK